MFCSKCGLEIKEGYKFCSDCGNAVTDNQQSTVHPQPPVNQYSQPTVQEKPKKNGKKIGGIVMAILGGAALLENIANGDLVNMMTDGFDLSDIVRTILQIGLLIGGILLIYTSNDK